MRLARLTDRVRGALMGSSRGVTLIEALIAMALVGIIAAAFLAGLATASRSAALADIRTNAESLARTHLEHAKSQGYTEALWQYEVTEQGSECLTDDNCPEWLNPDNALSPEYAGYTVLVEAEHLLEDPEDPESEVMDGIQVITVTVFYQPMYEDDPVITLSGYKVDR